MNSKYTANTAAASPQQRGRNLLIEAIIFVLVYAVSYLGNILIMAVLLECFYIPQFGNLIDFASIGNPNEIVTGIMALPYFPVMMLFSTVATIIVVILFCRLIQRRSWHSIGFSGQHAFPRYIWGYCVGVLAISIAVGGSLIAKAGYFESGEQSSALVVVLFFLAYLIQGASEEILCRGYFMYSVARRYPMWIAVVISSVFFAWLHLPNNGVSVAAFLNLFLFGVFAALITIRTGSIWYASGFHSAWNFFQGNFYGIKVSGMDMHGSLFHFALDPSKAWLNGGEFGIEGGFLCTALLTVGILLTLFQIHRNDQKKMV